MKHTKGPWIADGKETLSCIDAHTDDPVIGPIIEFAKRVIAKAEGQS